MPLKYMILGFSLLSNLSLFMLSASAESVAERKTVFIGGDWNYPPYEFINDAGEVDGFNTELTLAIADVMGMDIEIQLGNWDDMRSRLASGEIDALQGMVYSEDRARTLAFSPPHAIINQSIFGRKGEPGIEGLDDLNDKEVIVQEGGIMHDYLLNNKVDAQLILVETHAEAMRLLASGKHDYALGANLPGLYLGKELELSNIQPLGEPFGSQRYGYAVRQGDETLLAQFSEGLAILKNTGRYQEIYDKWLGPLEVGGLPWKRIGLTMAILSAVFLVLAGAVAIWNRLLSKEVARRTQELHVQQQQLIQADKMTSLGVLVSGVAHEINNPSSHLSLSLPILKGSFHDIEDILEDHYEKHGDFSVGGFDYSRMRNELPQLLDNMLVSTQRIRRIVDDLRDFARQEPSNLTEEVDLNQVTATAIRLVNNSIQAATDYFNVTYAEPIPMFKGNAQRIEQVIINLIVNACQALESRDKSLSISTAYQKESGVVQLQITDEGTGIDSESASRLFEPFFTTKRELGGTGLGLSVSLTIVEEHGGSLTCDSKPGRGTTMMLILPTPGGTTADEN